MMRAHLKLAVSLREVPFFRSLDDEVLARVGEYVYHREYEPRQIVYFPDDLCDHVYWLRSGRVKVTRVSNDGRDLTFRHLFEGDILGEECLVADGRREAYAEAMTLTILCLMRVDDFRRIAREEGEVSHVLAGLLCQRVMEVEHVLAETVFKTVRSRVASGLLRLYQRAPLTEDGALRITHQEIASLVGSTRETTTTVLHAFGRRVSFASPIAV